MDGWLHEWMDGWIEEWVDVWIEEWMDGWIIKCMYGWMKSECCTPSGPWSPSQNRSLKGGPKGGPKNKRCGQVAQRHPTRQVWRCRGMKEDGG